MPHGLVCWWPGDAEEQSAAQLCMLVPVALATADSLGAVLVLSSVSAL